MRTAAVAFLLSLVCAGVLTPLLRLVAVRRGLLDHAISSRKIHGRPVPRLGGIAIVVAFFAPLAGLLVFETGLGQIFLADRSRVIGLFVGGLAIAGLGVYDDLRGAGAKLKFVVQFAVAGLMYWLGFRVDIIANPFGDPLALGPLGLPFTLLWIVGVVNAMNLIDGLDGLAGGVALAAIATTFAIAFFRAEPLMVLFTAALGGAILGFLFYNFNPATIFMGDTGSMFLGFVLATASIQTSQKSSTVVAILVPIVTLGLPILDTLLAVARRAVRGRPLFSADREHIHHRLLALGLSQRQAALALYAVCIVLGLTGLALTFASSSQAAMLLAALALLSYFVVRRLGYLRFEPGHFLSDQRRRNRLLRAAVQFHGERIRQAVSEQAVWEAVREMAGPLQACSLALTLTRRKDAGDLVAVRFAISPGAESRIGLEGGTSPDVLPGAFVARFPVTGLHAGDAYIEVGWDDDRKEPQRDDEIAVEILCAHLAPALERIWSHDDAVATASVVALRK